MAKRKSAYENEYTRQMEEAVFDQHGYDNRKTEIKKQVREESLRQKKLHRVFYFLCLLILTIVSYFIVAAHGAEAAPPLVVFLAGCAAMFYFIRWLNRG